MKYLLIIIVVLTFSNSAFSQSRKNYFPIWTFHQKNANIHGVSVGLYSGYDYPRRTTTNGLKLELLGLGMFSFDAPNHSPISINEAEFSKVISDTISEKINGVVASSIGHYCNCNVNGISISIFAKLERRVNGISFALFGNFVEIHRGIQFAVISNETYKLRGVQIGLFNKSHDTKGFQIGLFNVNEKRTLPFINWNFKRRKK